MKRNNNLKKLSNETKTTLTLVYLEKITDLLSAINDMWDIENEDRRKDLIEFLKEQNICCHEANCDKCAYSGQHCSEERIADELLKHKFVR